MIKPPKLDINTYIASFLTLGILLLGCEQGSPDAPKGGIPQDRSLERVKKAGVLTWGTDVVENIPYTYEDPQHPGTYIGFEMDIAGAIAKELGVQLKLVSKAWDSLIPELQEGSFDMALNGIEDTENRQKIVLFSDPYFVYSQQLTVRKGTRGIHGLKDLRGKRAATLSGTAAEDLLRDAGDIQTIATPDVGSSYWSLEKGKVDAVLMDKPIAVAYAKPNPKLENVGESFAEGRYIVAFRMEDGALRDAVNRVLARMKQNGELKAIYSRWNLMDSHQKQIGIE